MQDWWRNAVIYQIYPRSFQDSSGDGIGDLAGITRRLPHVAGLGVDAIWLSPIFRSPMKDMGYDVSDYLDIDPLFGTLADFDALIAEAHRLGLKVIVDQVLSHSSDQHPWFKASRRDAEGPHGDWYVWADPLPDGSPPNNWLSVFGGSAWEWDSHRRQYYLHNFLTTQPDLNFHNPAVQEALLDSVKFWIERGVDGFRLDTVNYYVHDAQLRSNPGLSPPPKRPAVNPYDMQTHLYDKTRPENLGFLRKLRALTDRYEGRTLVGEVGEHGHRSVEIMAEYTEGGDKLHMAYSFALLSNEFDPAHLRDTIETFFKEAPHGCPCWSFSNHDVIRHVSRWSGLLGLSEDATARLAFAVLGSLQGTLCLYQGEELGQTETDLLFEELTDPPGIRFWPDYKGRDGCRTPMVWDDNVQGGFTGATPWLPVKAPQLARNVAGQASAPGSVLSFYKTVLAFRRARPELKDGGTEWIDLPHPMFGFHRVAGGRRLTCLFNLSSEAQKLSLKGPATRSAGPGDPILTETHVELPPGGFAWLESSGAEAPEVSA